MSKTEEHKLLLKYLRHVEIEIGISVALNLNNKSSVHDFTDYEIQKLNEIIERIKNE